MNVANKITLARIVLIPALVVVFYLLGTLGGAVSAIIFILLAATDFIDGYIARKKNIVTDIGKFLDPLADKVLALAAMLLILESNIVASPYGTVGAMIILTREFVISGVRLVAANSKRVIAANIWGKLKTIFMDIGLAVLLLVSKGNPFVWLPDSIFNIVVLVGTLIMGVAVVLSLVSMIVYILQNKIVFVKQTPVASVNNVAAHAHKEIAREIKNNEAIIENIVSSAVASTPTAETQSANIFDIKPMSYHKIDLVRNISQEINQDLFDDIMIHVITTNKISASDIQSKFKISYRQAYEAIDKMEAEKYVTKLTANEARKVLITISQYQAIINSRKK